MKLQVINNNIQVHFGKWWEMYWILWLFSEESQNSLLAFVSIVKRADSISSSSQSNPILNKCFFLNWFDVKVSSFWFGFSPSVELFFFWSPRNNDGSPRLVRKWQTNWIFLLFLCYKKCYALSRIMHDIPTPSVRNRMGCELGEINDSWNWNLNNFIDWCEIGMGALKKVKEEKKMAVQVCAVKINQWHCVLCSWCKHTHMRVECRKFYMTGVWNNESIWETLDVRVEMDKRHQLTVRIHLHIGVQVLMVTTVNS